MCLLDGILLPRVKSEGTHHKIWGKKTNSHFENFYNKCLIAISAKGSNSGDYIDDHFMQLPPFSMCIEHSDDI